MKDKPTGAGKSSFDLIDVRKFFTALDLQSGNVFLDLACGDGRYALKAADYVTEEGAIYAVDLWKEGIAALRSEARAKGIEHIHPRVADVSKHIPMQDRTVDVCLIATALHDLVRDGTHHDAMGEVTRVLRPAGKLVVLEFKNTAGPPGPPMSVRLSPPELKALLRPHGFQLMRTLDTGPYHYGSIFLFDRHAQP